MVIRPAAPADAAAIARIWHDGWQDGHLGHVPEELRAARTEQSFDERAAERAADSEGDAKTVVAVVGAAVAGFVMVVGDEVEQVYVAAAHRGRGVSGVLLAEAERLVAAGGHAEAWLAVVAGNATARRFYERHRWTDAGPFDHHAPGAFTVPAHRYVKPARP